MKIGLSVLFLIIMALYGYIIFLFRAGWKKNMYFITQNDIVPEIGISIICPFKNEITHLPYLFQAISEQNYPHFELILIDDYSTDGSKTYAEEVVMAFDHFQVVKNSGTGKKDAIKTGIYKAQNELIITLDADCLPKREWLKTIACYYQQHQPDLLMLPVKIDVTTDNYFTHFQQLEFVSLVASGAGAIGADVPIMCNGANLAFSKSAWIKSEQNLHIEEDTGDDIYLLQSIKRRGGSINFLKSKSVICTTQGKKSLFQFLKQHARWASKKAALQDAHYLGTALVVICTNLALVVSTVLAITNHFFLLLFLLLFVIKLTVDMLFFKQVTPFFEIKNTVKKVLLFSFLYPVYVVLTAVLALLPRKKW